MDKIFVSGSSAGGYLTAMVGLDKRWLAAHGIDADRIAGLIPLAGQMFTHFTVREERGIGKTEVLVDDRAGGSYFWITYLPKPLRRRTLMPKLVFLRASRSGSGTGF